MKSIHYKRLVLAFFIALLVGPFTQRAEAQDCQYPSVTIRMFPVKPGNDSLYNATRSSVKEFLDSMNQRPQGQLGVDGASDLAGACTYHQTYKILLIPVVPANDGVAYEVRGIHITPHDETKRQLTLSLDAGGNVVGAEVVTNDNRPKYREISRAEVLEMEQGDKIVRLIDDLEDAYNKDAVEVIKPGINSMPNLLRILNRAEIYVSKLKKNGELTSTRYQSSESYVNALANVIKRAGNAPQITYELVNVYVPYTVDNTGENRVDDTMRYKVTLVQHWMFPPEGYIDTDFVSLDIELDQSTSEPFITARNAGRGSFTIDTNPDGVQVTEIDGRDIASDNIKTPLNQFINTPWQSHYVTLEDLWYNTRYVAIDSSDVLNHVDAIITMTHKEGNVDLIVLPDDADATVEIDQNGTWVSPNFVDGILRVSLDQLKRVPPLTGAITSSTRDVRLRVSAPLYHTKDTTVTLTSPDAQEVIIKLERRTGWLAITTTPSASEAFVNASSYGKTPIVREEDVTLDGEFLSVSARNDDCSTGLLEQDCVLHIPSEVRQGRIQENDTTEVHFDLAPFIVRNLTNTADFSVELGNRDADDNLPIEVGILDKDDRNRSYVVEFEMHDRYTGEPLADLSNGLECTTENECFGRGIRPGAYSMLWGMADAQRSMPDNGVPVLTLRRRSLCWPCVLIPAAAGVAAAYIFPRTGSGGPLPFLPPPRPDDTP